MVKFSVQFIRLSTAISSIAFLFTCSSAFNTDEFYLKANQVLDHILSSEYDLSNPLEITDASGTFAEKDKCPPCFNCNLPNFECTQFSSCNTFTGRCECLTGFGGDDCSQPVCGGLSDGVNRPIRDHDDANGTFTPCQCEDGWGGVNCNMCTEDSVCDAFVPGDLKGTCYQSGIIVNKFHQMCDVTNKKIVEILDGDKPQVTFSCNKTEATCNFQFWIAQEESFYCELSKCDYQYDLNVNTTHYQCEDVQCKCLPEKMLCGRAGSIDISDFLTETIEGPGDFSCDINDKNCKFSEPSMNDLISNVFGDPYITLHCESGECLHASEIPGYELPSKPVITWLQIFRIGVAIAGCIVALGFVALYIKNSTFFGDGTGDIYLSDDADDDAAGSSSMMDDYKPAVFSFNNIRYKVEDKEILKGAFGIVKPGECLAIMGGSGAGKTTLLDILAGKNKSGSKSGSFYINGEEITTRHELRSFQKNIGFVDQEDFLIPTLTVYETVLNSALLRLPRTMSLKAKKSKVIQILSELRILHIKDKLIGSDFERGISGGEKRRVAIACELVTSPSILFLDEPTSGLDAYNARNVVESLSRLARDFQRTIIFTIHQPRSNIVALFDKLVLLAEGELIYSGDMLKCNEFFTRNGYNCPPGYNIADYLIDITSANEKSSMDPSINEDIEGQFFGHNHEDVHDLPSSDTVVDTTREWEHFAEHRDEFNQGQILQKRKTGKVVRSIVPPAILSIFKTSTLAEEVLEEINSYNKPSTGPANNGNNGIGNNQSSFLTGDPNKTRASFFTQLSILCSRTFKNSYRNPRLLLGHYILCILVGFFCSFLYYNVENNISGFQNRLGLFFFLLTLFGFSSLTGLHSFSVERIVFIRERSNNYYHPLSYYLSKILCDVIPLRLFPPVILMAIIYPLVGLNMEGNKFWLSILILVLFNLATAVEILIIGILIKEPGSATMVGVLVLLFSLLFAGLFINKESIPAQLAWFENISVFHYGYEALTVNEVNGLVLQETKYGLNIKVPGAVILSTFGFDVGAVVFDIWWLLGMLGSFLVLGYIGLHMFVYETR